MLIYSTIYNPAILIDNLSTIRLMLWKNIISWREKQCKNCFLTEIFVFLNVITNKAQESYELFEMIYLSFSSCRMFLKKTWT